jgi:hypothetical protein
MRRAWQPLVNRPQWLFFCNPSVNRPMLLGPGVKIMGAPGLLREDVFTDMVIHMKTTIEISDPLLQRTRKLARKERTTLRALVEEGLREVLAGRAESREFTLRRASFAGQGLRPELEGAPWDTIRNAAYEGRGS